MSKKSNTVEFIKKAKLIHGDKYDYSQVEYVNAHVKVKILCPEHGLFEQKPNNHLSGKICNICGNRYQDKDIFIAKANKIHGNEFDYSLVEYHSSNKKVKIVCKLCNEVFDQTPNSHLMGSKCNLCCNNKKLKDDEILDKFYKIHQHKFDYSLMVYVNTNTKIKIICNTCKNIFHQRPTDHCSGQGCPKCLSSKGENKINEWLIKNDIVFVRQMVFEKCLHKRKLPFDFYIPILNICIEYDGEQHYKPERRSKDPLKNLHRLEQVQLRDKIKTKYCKDNNIKLIRIPYTEQDRIEEILKEHL